MTVDFRKGGQSVIKGLAKLKKVDLKEVWQHEAYDFSKWLVETENLGLLGEEIGLEIKPIQSEAPVGKFSVDILAEEEGSGRKIIIENQLQSTDHDHLGKIITYASGYDAELIIWIVKECREEHQRAVDWLNEHTDEKIGFFLIKMELWQIDNSLPAPKFVIIVSPNEWAKTVKKGNTDPLTDTKLKQLDFWTAFRTFVESRDKSIKLKKPQPQHWYDLSLGFSGTAISLNMNSNENWFRCQLYIYDNKPLFNFLLHKKEEIAPRIGQSEWVDSQGKFSAVRLEKKVSDVFDHNERDKHFEWLLTNALLLKKVFGPYLKDFKEKGNLTKATSDGD